MESVLKLLNHIHIFNKFYKYINENITMRRAWKYMSMLKINTGKIA